MAVSTGPKFEHFGRCVGRCESPIERLFLVALLFSERFGFEPAVEVAGIAVALRTGLVLHQQVDVARHRLDFALTHLNRAARLAVEIDGAPYHRGEQDRVRDRTLLAEGWTTIRFTGSEVTRDAVRCAAEAIRIARTIAEPRADRPALARARGVPYEEWASELVVAESGAQTSLTVARGGR